MLFSQGRKDGVNAGVWGNANAGIKNGKNAILKADL